MKDCGVKLLRIREHPLEKIENLDIVYKKDKSYFAILKKILKKIAIFDLIGSAEKQKITAYMEENKPQNDKLYREMIFSTKLDENLAKNYPEIAKEWDYEKIIHKNLKISLLIHMKKLPGNVKKATNGLLE